MLTGPGSCVDATQKKPFRNHPWYHDRWQPTTANRRPAHRAAPTRPRHPSAAAWRLAPPPSAQADRYDAAAQLPGPPCGTLAPPGVQGGGSASETSAAAGLLGTRLGPRALLGVRSLGAVNYGVVTARKSPPDLTKEGQALWWQIERWRKAERLTFDPHEAPMVDELARTADRLAAIRGALAELDPVEPAWVRLAAEERQQRLAYGRQVSSLGFPSGVVDAPDRPARPAKGSTPRSRRAQKAAQSRWGMPGAS